ncbi:hypothetical protein FA13DRAFT_1719141 [Coprinellus micaceus]|uniref:Uncharacterized protein n=1 Tax=Coprinellus micaceus TaxID=71717 RepID=A0A4Y7SDW1_COPMI|nr:hypothetical protein FA13DRAFT_1719141 [Coprinellus micaceus]
MICKVPRSVLSHLDLDSPPLKPFKGNQTFESLFDPKTHLHGAVDTSTTAETTKPAPIADHTFLCLAAIPLLTALDPASGYFEVTRLHGGEHRHLPRLSLVLTPQPEPSTHDGDKTPARNYVYEEKLVWVEVQGERGLARELESSLSAGGYKVFSQSYHPSSFLEHSVSRVKKVSLPTREKGHRSPSLANAHPNAPNNPALSTLTSPFCPHTDLGSGRRIHPLPHPLGTTPPELELASIGTGAPSSGDTELALLLASVFAFGLTLAVRVDILPTRCPNVVAGPDSSIPLWASPAPGQNLAFSSPPTKPCLSPESHLGVQLSLPTNIFCRRPLLRDRSTDDCVFKRTTPAFGIDTDEGWKCVKENDAGSGETGAGTQTRVTGHFCGEGSGSNDEELLDAAKNLSKVGLGSLPGTASSSLNPLLLNGTSSTSSSFSAYSTTATRQPHRRDMSASTPLSSVLTIHVSPPHSHTTQVPSTLNLLNINAPTPCIPMLLSHISQLRGHGIDGKEEDLLDSSSIVSIAMPDSYYMATGDGRAISSAMAMIGESTMVPRRPSFGTRMRQLVEGAQTLSLALRSTHMPSTPTGTSIIGEAPLSHVGASPVIPPYMTFKVVWKGIVSP